MTDEYIHRDDAIRLAEQGQVQGFPWQFQMLVRLPPVDVVQVTHSRWIKTEDGAECEKCGREAVYQIVDDHWEYEPWCPHCGAKMNAQEGE